MVNWPPWRRRQPEPQPEPQPGRTLDDAEVHQLALAVATAAAYVPGKPNGVAEAEADIRVLVAGLGAADLAEVCAGCAAFSVWAFQVNGASLEQVRDAFQYLTLKQAAARR